MNSLSNAMRKLPNKFLAAMIAVKALPGTPLYDGNDDRIMEDEFNKQRAKLV